MKRGPLVDIPNPVEQHALRAREFGQNFVGKEYDFAGESPEEVVACMAQQTGVPHDLYCAAERGDSQAIKQIEEIQANVALRVFGQKMTAEEVTRYVAGLTVRDVLPSEFDIEGWDYNALMFKAKTFWRAAEKGGEKEEVDECMQRAFVCWREAFFRRGAYYVFSDLMNSMDGKGQLDTYYAGA